MQAHYCRCKGSCKHHKPPETRRFHQMLRERRSELHELSSRSHCLTVRTSFHARTEPEHLLHYAKNSSVVSASRPPKDFHNASALKGSTRYTTYRSWQPRAASYATPNLSVRLSPGGRTEPTLHVPGMHLQRRPILFFSSCYN